MVKGGYSSLMDPVAASLDIRKGTAVSQITYDSRGVKVTSTSGNMIPALPSDVIPVIFQRQTSRWCLTCQAVVGDVRQHCLVMNSKVCCSMKESMRSTAADQDSPTVCLQLRSIPVRKHVVLNLFACICLLVSVLLASVLLVSVPHWNAHLQAEHSECACGGCAGDVFEGAAVIVTVPLGCLKAGDISFQPALPAWKTEAIDKLGFGNLNKVPPCLCLCWNLPLQNLASQSNKASFCTALGTKTLVCAAPEPVQQWALCHLQGWSSQADSGCRFCTALLTSSQMGQL